MVSLKVLLSSLEGRQSARLELMSGRRPRLVFSDDTRGRGEVKNLADEALTDDEVLALCESAGAGRRLDSIDDGPAEWSCTMQGVTYRVTAELRGREIAAVFTHGEAKGAATRANQAAPSGRPTRKSQPAIKSQGPRSERDRPRRQSQSDRAQAPRSPEKPAGVARSRSRDAILTAQAQLSSKNDDTTRRPTPREGRAQAHVIPVIQQPPAQGSMRQAAQVVHQAPAAASRRATLRPMPAVTGPSSTRRSERAPKITTPQWPTEHGSANRFATLLLEGHRMAASDLHLVPRRPAVFRVGGSLVPTRETFPAGETERAIFSLVPEALRHAFEVRGGVDFALEVPKLGRFRVNVSLTLRGLKASLRFLPRDPPTLESLGLPSRLREATSHHQGLVILTGPTGHGKTTTLAALVNHLNETTTHHIITVEDPVEILHPRKNAIVSQREVGTHTQSFARALKGALRQDPDVIVVGELRDTETVRMALSASETGHLVLGTMNTPSAAATIEALIDLFPPGDQPQVRTTLAGGLKYIVSQRLVRNADGSARVAAVETLPGSLPLWNLIRDQKTFQLPSLMQRGKGLGVMRLNESLLALVESGAVKAADAIYSSDAPEELEALIKGEPRREETDRGQPDLVGGLLGRAGAFFSRKGGD